MLAYKLSTILCAIRPSQRICRANKPPPPPRHIASPTNRRLITRAAKPYLLPHETIPFAR